MSILRRTALTLSLSLLTMPALADVTPVPARMNFQGRAARPDGTPVTDGTYAIRFSLWDSQSGGNEKWSQTLANVTIRNGTFAAPLTGFTNSTFDGELFLEIKVGNDAPLTPRQPLASVAYAMKANTVPDGSITGAKIANGAITADKLASDAINSVAWLLSGNSGTNPSSQFLGTTDNQPLAFKTNGQERMRLMTNGRLGVGVTNPAAMLTINNNITGVLPAVPGMMIGNPEGGSAAISLGKDSTSFLTVAWLNTGYGTISTSGDKPLALQKDSVGGVGIGTTSPNQRLTVQGGAGAYMNVKTSGGAQELLLGADTSGGVVSTMTDHNLNLRAGGNKNILTLNRNGFVGINNTAPIADFQVNGTDNHNGTALLASAKGPNMSHIHYGLDGHWYIRSAKSAGSVFIQDTGGFTGIGTGTPNNPLTVAGSGGMGIGLTNGVHMGLQSDGNPHIELVGAGKVPFIDFSNANNNDNNARIILDAHNRLTITAENVRVVGNFINASDARYKKEVAPIANALDSILNLNGVSFAWNQEGSKDLHFPEGRSLGFLAQEVEKALPQLVTTDQEGYKSVSYIGVVPVLVEAMKEQNKQMNALKAENAELKAQLNTLAEAVRELQRSRE